MKKFLRENRERLSRLISSVSALLMLFSVVFSANSETIIIGKGSGVVWTGFPFNFTEKHDLDRKTGGANYGMVAVSDIISRCMQSNNLTNIGGYMAYKVAPGVGIIPIANVNALYWHLPEKPTTLSGTIGIPNTAAIDSEGQKLQSSVGYAWCITPTQFSGPTPGYFSQKTRTVSVNGQWAVVADGRQSSTEVHVKPMYFGSFTSGGVVGDIHQQIFPSDIILRVSTLSCSVETPTLIDFGEVSGRQTAGAEIAKKRTRT